jgi:cyclic pyranopterin phosphate synthase
MPAEGLPWLPGPELLTVQEILTVAEVCVSHGVEKIRLTGGEPLLRRELLEIISGLAKLSPRPEISLTSNGLGLEKMAASLRDAGLNRINISLDTLDQERFLKLTHRDRLADVFSGIKAAEAAGFTPIKINAVLMRGINEDEAPKLLAWALERGYQMRFIEQMPLDPQHGWNRNEMLTADEIIAKLELSHVLTPLDERGSSPAELFLVDDGPATVGIIGSVTRPFCADCDRIRLTSDGQIRNCLFATSEADVRGILRSGLPAHVIEQQVAEVLFAEVRMKKKGHGIGDPEFEQPKRPMSAIGG